MRKLFLLSLLLACVCFLPAVSHAQALTCGPSPTVTTAASGEQQLVAAITGHSILICYVIITAVNSATAGDVSIDYGTGSSCGTGTTASPFNFAKGAASTPMSFLVGSPLSPVWAAPAGNALCINFAQAPTEMKATVFYAIQ